jgi:DNA-binding GntR family transcriptional regulator
MNYLIDYQDLSYKAYEQIKAMILKGEIKPGEKLIQELIARQLGISRMPLHKAFQMLENDMLVENQPRRGIYVREIDLAEIADAFECREAIEGIAGKRAAEKITKHELEILKGFFEPFRRDPVNADLIKYQEADRSFHNMVIRISANRILARMEMLANILSNTYRRGLIRPPVETLPEHYAIIDALSARDGDMAEQLFRKHFALSRQVVMNELAKNNREKIKKLTI